MMLANVYAKSLRDRYLGWIIGVGSLVLMALFGAFVYRDLDDFVLGLIDSLPEGVLSVLGMTQVTDAASYMITAMFTTYGPFIVIGLAISMGVSAIAGEEREGTFGILHANPMTRSHTVTSKTLALVTLVGLGAAITAAGMWLVGRALDLDLSSLDLGAAAIHLGATGLVYGLMGLALGSWTGRASFASGVTTAYLILSFFAAGVLPLIASLAWIARFFPWHYMNDGQPIANGVVWTNVSILIITSIVMFVVAVVGVNRRDVRTGGSASSLRERIANNPRLSKLVSRLEGSGPSTDSIFAKAFTDSRVLMISVGLGVGYLALLEGPLYNLLDDVLAQFSDAFPPEMMAIMGVNDFSTPAGWLSAEMFSIVAPAAGIVLASSMAARALGGEQDRGTMDVLLANPVTRSRVVVEKVAAMIIAVIGFGAFTLLGTWAGVAIGRLDVAVDRIAAVSVHLVALCLAFGGLAFWISAATGRARTTSMATAGLAVVAYILNAFGTVNDRFEWMSAISPFGYYLRNDPLSQGIDLLGVGILLTAASVLIGLAVRAFQKADIRV